MSQNTLIEKIKQDAATTVAEIKVDEATKGAELRREADKVIRDLKATRALAMQKQHNQTELVAVSKAKQSAKIALQSTKREEMNVLFSALETDLSTQTSVEYVKFFQKYAMEMVPSDAVVTVVQVPKNREAETKQILENFDLAEKVSVLDNIKAGFILHTADGLYDVTLARLISEKRAKLEMKMVLKVMPA